MNLVLADGSILRRLGVDLQRDESSTARPVPVRVLRPWEFRKPDGSVGVCAWCQAEQGVDLNTIAHTSHGICPVHFNSIKAELARRAAA